ncbi:hypothetical protein, partial [Cerasicoccus maritimus]|uniref:hypothetical protein n=1 Tax=Cerasicoccus maritimus TaxID=490089 RepID=UPI0028528228
LPARAEKVRIRCVPCQSARGLAHSIKWLASRWDFTHGQAALLFLLIFLPARAEKVRIRCVPCQSARGLAHSIAGLGCLPTKKARPKMTEPALSFKLFPLIF